MRHLQRKIKRLQENHAESKQDYALKIFALKDENKKLIEDNETLEGKNKYGGILGDNEYFKVSIRYKA